jgi:hypothetical protein
MLEAISIRLGNGGDRTCFDAHAGSSKKSLKSTPRCD